MRVLYGAAKAARRNARTLDSIIVAQIRAKRDPVKLAVILDGVVHDWGTVSSRSVLRRLAALTRRRRVVASGRNPRRRYASAGLVRR